MIIPDLMPAGIPLVDIFWTGGWDSTYRVLCLSRQEVIIQPHYIYYEHRRTAARELATMEAISEAIRKDPRTKCQLKPLITVNERDIPPDEAVMAALGEIRRLIPLGPQYNYLARYAKNFSHIEIGIETGGDSDVLIETMGKMNYIREGSLSYWELDRENSQAALLEVFGHTRWPLFKLSKLEMLEGARQQGFDQIMDMTWFCHFPVGGKPCGSCVPCWYAIEGGLAYRLPPKAIKRHRTDQKFKNNKIYQAYKRLRRKLLNY